MKKLLITFILLLVTHLSYSQWVSNISYQGSGDNFSSSAKGEAVTSDNYGNCYITGFYYDPVQNYNIFTIKYSPLGDTLWNRSYNGTANGDDRAFGIVVDANGFVYVCGTTTSIGTSYDMLIIKYDSNGNKIWEKKYTAENTPSEDRAFGIVVDSNGFIIVTGYCTKADGFTDIVVLKLDANSNTVWTFTEDGSDNLNSQGLALTVDDNNDIYVTGFTSSNEYEDMALLKVLSTGSRKYLKTFKGPAKQNDRGLGIVIDNTGFILICGYQTMTTNLKTALYVGKFKPSDGGKQWERSFNNLPASNDKALGITVDADNYVYVTGYTGYSDSLCNFLTLRYNPSGNLVWAKTYNGTGNKNDQANAIGFVNCGANKYIVVTGKSWGTDSNYDFAVIKYNALDGNLVTLSIYSYNEITNDIPTSLDVFGSCVYITGYSELIVNSILPPSYASTMMFKYGKSSELNSEVNLPSKYQLYQNIPNPFNPSTTIKFDLIKSSNVKITIYDILGRTVDVLLNTSLGAGTHTLNYNNSQLSSGIYFYELKTDDFVGIKKMTLIK
jgi:hypothetical protein